MSENIRSPLIRTLYAKLEHQQSHSENSHPEWYSVRSGYLQPEVFNAFVQSFQDDETNDFLASCFIKSDWIFTHFYHAIAKSVLTWFMTATSVNGLLRRGSMFVLSSAQFATLLDLQEDRKLNRLLDLGAGDGLVTSKMAPFFNVVHVTELSGPMRWRLAERGFNVIDADSWSFAPGDPTVRPHYDVVSCLNLLDRCDRPLTMLRQIATVLEPTAGRLLLGLVLPLKQYVETNPGNRPTELLDIPKSKIWEVQLNTFISDILEPCGFELVRWTRVPYLCEGDFTHSFYYLSDVVLVLRLRDSVSDI